MNKPPNIHRCGAPTKKGSPCNRIVHSDKHRYCKWHEDERVRKENEKLRPNNGQSRAVDTFNRKKQALRDRLDPGPLPKEDL